MGNENINPQLTFPPRAMAREPQPCFHLPPRCHNVHTKAGETEPVLRHLQGPSASSLGGAGILQERSLRRDPQEMLSQGCLSYLPAAWPAPILAGSIKTGHLVSLHPHCSQVRHFSCSLCPLIPDRPKSKTRPRFMR